MKSEYRWQALDPIRTSSEAVSHGVRIRVRSFYIPDRSAPYQGSWVFGYAVTISNEGRSRVRLISRHWIITDGGGLVHHVRGPGVVGQHPEIEPGHSFEYTSSCPLNTHVGFMRGSFTMSCHGAPEIQVGVEEFAFLAPGSLN